MAPHLVRRAVAGLALLSGCFALRPSAGGGQLSHVPTSRTVDAADVAVPRGYSVEAVATGLVFPTAVTFDDRGTPYVVEAGYSYGEVTTTPRIVAIEGGAPREVVSGDNGPWTGAVWTPEGFVVAEGGVERGGRIVRHGEDGAVSVLVDGLPSLGDHHTNGPVIHDGYVWFGQGTATNAAVVGADNRDFGWLARHPAFHDVPCEDVTLAGVEYETDNLRVASGGVVRTGAFVPYATRTLPGTVVHGERRCNGAVLRVPLAGGEPEVVAWGFRNPFGLAFSGDGALFVTDNGYDVRGSRPVFGAGDLLWRVEPGRWYGWPDFVAGLPLDDRRFAGPGDPLPRRVLQTAPEQPPLPVATFGVHASADGIAFPPGDGWGSPDHAFVALFGDMAPGVGKVLYPVGFQVARVDVRTGAIDEFVSNRGERTGPASWLGTGGLERPVAVAFDPVRGDLWIVDFGVLAMSEAGPAPLPGTGVLWRVRREGGDARISR